jgi:glycerophosphoryl diester phosphodiesterase
MAKGHGFELDILLSKDNKAMVFHDVPLKRLTGRAGRIDDYTAVQLSHYILTGSQDTIPALAHLLSTTDNDHPILVEIKGDQGRPDDIAKAVHDDIHDFEGSLAIMSFYPDIVRWFQKNAPQVPRGLVATTRHDGEMPNDYYTMDTQISLIEELAVDFIAYDIQALPNKVTKYCRTKDIPVLTWTVRSAELYQRARQHTDNIIYENLDL